MGIWPFKSQYKNNEKFVIGLSQGNHTVQSSCQKYIAINVSLFIPVRDKILCLYSYIYCLWLFIETYFIFGYSNSTDMHERARAVIEAQVKCHLLGNHTLLNEGQRK